jgi:hypothetical protein
MDEHTEIGLNSSKEEGESSVGIRAKKVELKALKVLPFIHDSSTIPKRSSSIRS